MKKVLALVMVLVLLVGCAACGKKEEKSKLDQIKEAAKNLGLIMPGSEQVRYYSVENSDYMNQYGEIPSN